MKVLWFTNTPSLAEGYFRDSLISGGWIKSLERMIQKEVKLSVAFYCSKEIKSFEYGSTTYYPINKYPYGWLNKIKRKMYGSSALQEDIDKYLKVIECVQPDIIHIHGTELPFGLIQKYTKIPVVISIQGNISVYTIKYFSGLSKSEVRKYSSIKDILLLGPILGNYFKFKKMAMIEKEIFSLTKNIIGRTDWDQRISKVLAPKAKYYLGNEILRDVFYDRTWEVKENKILKLFTTNGSAIYKGIEIIIYTSYLLEKAGIDFYWNVAGIGKNDSILSIASKSLGIKLSKKLNFLGKINENELVKGLLDSHIYIMPSHIENSPNNLCEAQIIGLPIISSFVGGVGSLIINNLDGVLVQDGDPYVLAGAIIENRNNYGKSIAMAENAKKKASVRHDPVQISLKLIALYNRILKK